MLFDEIDPMQRRKGGRPRGHTPKVRLRKKLGAMVDALIAQAEAGDVMALRQCVELGVQFSSDKTRKEVTRKLQSIGNSASHLPKEEETPPRRQPARRRHRIYNENE